MTTNKLYFVEDGTETLEERKKNLRNYVKSRRADTVNRDVKEALLIENFLQVVFGEERKSIGAGTQRTFFIYLSFSSEAPTDKLIEKLVEAGHKVYCPRIENGEMYAVLYGEGLTLSNYGIREPLGEIFDEDVDFVVTPLLAVDRQGNRLGYGGGYYDRYLSSHKKSKRVGYCFDFQIMENVPWGSKDEKLEIVVTDKRVLYINE